jgi:hypothetical protein
MKAFMVWHPDYEGCVVIHAETRSKARYKVWLEAHQVYDSWKIFHLNAKHQLSLDNVPINKDTLFGLVGESDRYQKECKCEICTNDRKHTNA